MLLQTLQFKLFQHFLNSYLRFFFPGLFRLQSRHQILAHRHIGKQGVILEQQSHMTILGPQIDVLLRIKKHLAVQLNISFVRLHNTRNTAERHALAAAGGSQNPGHPLRSLKLRFQPEISQLFSDIHIQ